VFSNYGIAASESITGVYFLFCPAGVEKRFSINANKEIVQFKDHVLFYNEKVFIHEYFGL